MLGASGSGFGFTGGASIEGFLAWTGWMVMGSTQQQAFHIDNRCFGRVLVQLKRRRGVKARPAFAHSPT